MAREAISPTASGGRGSVSGAAGSAAATMIVASYPEMLPFAWMVGAAVTGVLSGLGNAARSSPNPWISGLLSWIG